MAKIANFFISIALLIIIGTVLTSIFAAFDWPTLYGFWNYVAPAILALSNVPVIGTFVSIIAWVLTFEMAMFTSRLVIWLANALQGNFERIH